MKQKRKRKRKRKNVPSLNFINVINHITKTFKSSIYNSLQLISEI